MAATPATGDGTPVVAPAPQAARPVGPARSTLRELGDLVVFAGHAAAALPRSLPYFSEGLRQGSMMLRGTIPLLAVIIIFFGFTVTNFAFFFLRSIGASDYMGVISGYGGPRMFVSMLFGYVFTARVCCGIAAELGSMKIQQEIDALNSTGVDPMRYLVGTRLIGVLLVIPVGTAVALIGSLAGIYLNTVTVLNGIDPHVLLDVNWSVQTLDDQIIAIFNVGTIALVTATIACFYGLRTQGGPAAVGTSVARSLYMNLIAVHAIAVFYAVFFYGTDLKLPIGG